VKKVKGCAGKAYGRKMASGTILVIFYKGESLVEKACVDSFY